MLYKQRLLYVSDAHRSESLRRSLRSLGIAPSFARDVKSAFNQLTRTSFDVVAIDLSSTVEAFDFIKRIKSAPIFKTTRIVVVGEWGTGQPALALSLGADAYEPTPVDAIRLLESMTRLPKQRAAAANRN